MTTNDDANPRGPWFAVGRILYQNRVDRGLSQAQVALAVGTRQEEVSRDEAGRVRGVPADRLVGYVRLYGLDGHALLSVVYGPILTGAAR